MPNAEDNYCRKNWWTNLLYVNNFVKTTKPVSYQPTACDVIYIQETVSVYAVCSQCVGWSWYLANDMQFYIVAPLVLIPLYL